jgi:hypothetical protein
MKLTTTHFPHVSIQIHDARYNFSIVLKKSPLHAKFTRSFQIIALHSDGEAEIKCRGAQVFQKIWHLGQNSRRQKGDMKQVPS